MKSFLAVPGSNPKQYIFVYDLGVEIDDRKPVLVIMVMMN